MTAFYILLPDVNSVALMCSVVVVALIGLAPSRLWRRHLTRDGRALKYWLKRYEAK